MSAIMPQQLGPIEEIFPIEIIAHIFILCLPKDPLRHFQPDLTRAPLLLCHVCSVWRTIALNTPQLWNHFHHRLPIPRVSSSKSFWRIRPSSLDFMEWWSQNVRGDSLSLRLALKWSGNSHDWPSNPNRSASFLFSMLKSTRFLEIEQSYALMLERLRLRPWQYPNLESIFIREDPHDRDDSPWYISPSSWQISPSDFSFLYAPSVRKLASKKHYFLPNVLPSGKIHFSPSHLTHLFVNLSLSLSKWAILISGCETLEYARIHFTIKPEVEDNPVATRTSQSIVPRLRQLVLDCSSPELEHVLDNLSLPSLHSLHLRSEASALYGYVLPQLSICGLAALLSATPSLRILEISIPFRYNWISNSPPPSIPGHQRLGKCAPSLEILVLDVFNTRPGCDGMSPMEYISEMKNCGWLDNVWNRPTTEQKLRIVLVLEFPRNILHWLERVEDELDGVHISAEISTSTALRAWEISQEEHPKDRWFEEAKCTRLI
ncbi:hypothetical protein M413DRAFT_245635 [Hebeloma cylindrosporum]|uniref:Uncharacterized protein n=1 Tax=Hebeloma cylindrosporum TaxID=76867 RepID=A0A0C3C289_HEBCY|nr:hypothetical protein M413DRAFT_245635 [Hebeloma cylindrosporum h7]